jgi:hypothetical protein
MLETLATGEVRSKLSGVRWASGNLEGRWSGLIRRAWAERPDPSSKICLPADPDDLARTHDFIDHALAKAVQIVEGIGRH